MANRNLTRSQVLNRGEVIICGSFAPNGAGAVDAASNKGIGWSVARTGVGAFTVTLEDKWIAVLSGQAQLQLAAVAGQVAQLGATDVTSAKTVEVRVVDTATGLTADVAADANNRIHFELRLKNSTTN
jgi:hypothetical protein